MHERIVSLQRTEIQPTNFIWNIDHKFTDHFHQTVVVWWDFPLKSSCMHMMTVGPYSKWNAKTAKCLLSPKDSEAQKQVLAAVFKSSCQGILPNTWIKGPFSDSFYCFWMFSSNIWSVREARKKLLSTVAFQQPKCIVFLKLIHCWHHLWLTCAHEKSLFMPVNHFKLKQARRGFFPNFCISAVPTNKEIQHLWCVRQHLCHH